MPTHPVVDAHLHLRDATRPWYPGAAESATATGTSGAIESFLLADYERAAGELEIAGLVHVSAATAPHAYLAETRWIETLAAADARPVALLGGIDPALSAPELVDHLEQQARSVAFRGIRVPRGLAPNTAAAETVAAWLQDRDAVLDLAARPEEMLDWIDFLAGYPALRVVLEHLGSPQGVDAEAKAVWHNALSLAAKETPWLCKLSGLGAICPHPSRSGLEYWLESGVQLWGWRRLMFASELPAPGGAHPELLAIVDGLVAGDATDQEAGYFYAGNAADAYRLG
ncbi:amidohydrolase family protein [Nocardia sp. NPDC005978]|uniref:amidohydrolase family protein n=1 Tax=Nocardia sp. NPDC005978 TaxID=3156725 RepID=UPI0033A7673A